LPGKSRRFPGKRLSVISLGADSNLRYVTSGTTVANVATIVAITQRRRCDGCPPHGRGTTFFAPGSQQAGTSSYGVGAYFNGSLADVSIFGSAFSAAQVNNLYVGESAQMGQLPSTTPLSIADEATYDLNGASQTAASLADVAGAGGTVTNSTSSSVTLTLAPTGTTTFSGVIQNGNGVVSLTVNGLGTQVLAGNNTYTGATVVNGGHLIVTGASGSTLSATTVSAGTLEVDGAWTTAILNVTASGSLGGQGTGQLVGKGSITLTGGNLYYNSSGTSNFAGTLASSSTNAGLEHEPNRSSRVYACRAARRDRDSGHHHRPDAAGSPRRPRIGASRAVHEPVAPTGHCGQHPRKFHTPLSAGDRAVVF
jgi:autotransporter-associated beta strand protein